MFKTDLPLLTLAQTSPLGDGAIPPPPGDAATATGTGAGTGAAGGGSGGDLFGSFFPILLLLLLTMIVVTVFGQRRDRKKRQAVLSAAKKHDRVQTVGGVIGSIVELNPDTVVLKVDESSNTRITFARSSIQQVLTSAPDGGGAGPGPGDDQ